jgi:hypothetical protein
MQVTWASVSAYASDFPATADVYTSSVPTVFLGILRGSSELASLWAHFPTGEVFSAEWVAGSTAPVGFCTALGRSSVGRQHTAPPLDTVPGSRAAQAHSEPAAQQSALLHGTHAQAL